MDEKDKDKIRQAYEQNTSKEDRDKFAGIAQEGEDIQNSPTSPGSVARQDKVSSEPGKLDQATAERIESTQKGQGNNYQTQADQKTSNNLPGVGEARHKAAQQQERSNEPQQEAGDKSATEQERRTGNNLPGVGEAQQKAQKGEPEQPQPQKEQERDDR